MRLARGILLGAWLIVGINLLMAFGAIGIFSRMTPAIAEIIVNNELSLQACEEMLAAIALANSGIGDKNKHYNDFKEALTRALKNITEAEEPEILDVIQKHSEKAFSGDKKAIETVTQATLDLCTINRNAMATADRNAQQLGKGGAWGIVFMATCSFLAGIIFIRNLSSKLLGPLQELKTVLMANQSGETRRRCAGANLPADIRAIFGNINTFLDRSMHDTFKN